MAVYFVVDNEQSVGYVEPVPRTYNSVKTLDRPKAARFVKLEAASVAEAQEGYRQLYPGNSSLPVVVTEAQWKTS